MRELIRGFLRRSGYDVIRYLADRHPDASLSALMKSREIDTVVDVGANVGQFGRRIRRRCDYRGAIFSYEPLSSAYEELRLRAESDDKWQCMQCAVGSAVGVSEINVAANSQSSSLLDMTERHQLAEPRSQFIGRERIQLLTLDKLFEDYHWGGAKLFVKIDVQGYEAEVLAGGKTAISHARLVQVEGSLEPMYSGEATAEALCDSLRSYGFKPVAIFPVFADNLTGDTLQVDMTFSK